MSSRGGAWAIFDSVTERYVLVDVKRIKKLSGQSDYCVWAKVVEANMASAGILKIVTGHKVKPDPATDPEDAREWEAEDAFAQLIILATIKPELKDSLYNCNTSFELWKTVRDTYGPPTWSEQALIIQFYKLERGNNTPLKLVYKVLNLANQLSALKSPLSKEMIIGKILSCLSTESKYLSLIECWLNIPKADQTVSRLISRLSYWAHVEAVQKSRGMTGEPQEVKAFYSKNAHNSKQKQSGGNQGGNLNNAQSTGKKKPVKCFNCGQKGHFKRDCKNPANKREQKEGCQ